MFQTIAGCELLDNDKPGMLLLKDSVNGLINEEWIFNMAKNSWVITTEWATGFTQTSMKLAAENAIRFICLKHLQRYLHMEKNNVLKKGEIINFIQLKQYHMSKSPASAQL